MFTLKPLAATAIFISGILWQQSVVAYPKTSPSLEMDYIVASIENMYGKVNSEMLTHLEQLYQDRDPSTEIMLSGGYQVCDGIKLANAQGMTSKMLIEQEIDDISEITNTILAKQGISLTEEQIIMAYKTANNYLCPELD